MKAAVFYRPETPLRLQDVRQPSPEPGEVLVHPHVCGICHTDYAMWKGTYQPRKKPPVIFGHEICGRIAAVGPGVGPERVGERVAVLGVVSCSRCRQCVTGRTTLCDRMLAIGIDTDGGFAEYLTVPAQNAQPLPPEIPDRAAALACDSIATPFHAVGRAEVQPGESVAVFGCGGLGINAVQIAARLKGARVIAVDLNPALLSLAMDLGADAAVSAAQGDPVAAVRSLTGGEGVDVAMEFVGLPLTYEQALASVRKGGRLVGVGAGDFRFSVPADRLFKDEVTLYGSYGVTGVDFQTVLQLVASGRIDVQRLPTPTVPLDEINRGFELLESRVGNPIRVLVSID